MRLPLRRAAAFLALILVCTGLHGTPVHAATGRRTGGITISPAFRQVTLDAKSPTTTFNFSVTNNTGAPYEFALSTIDFGSLDESGGVLFIGKTDKALNYKYGLSQYVTLGQDRIVVEPKATITVPVTLTNKESLAPGGHYGAILVTPTRSSDRPIKVEINQVLSSLLFVTKQGGEIYDLSLRDYEVKTHLFTAPSGVDLRFQNAGNIHVVPRGVAILTDPRGKVVKKGFINAGSAIVLPETFRRLTIPLESVSSAWLPGRYHLSIAYRYDGKESVQTREISFVYINGWYLVGAAALVAFAVLLALNKKFRRAVFAVFRAIGKTLAKLLNVRRLFTRRMR